MQISAKEDIEVTVIIVCMNNLGNLYPCLDSIKAHTSLNYETIVVAYMFSEENLAKAKEDFPWVRFIESNEIRGFSENNNLALREAKGRFCFVVNDDTSMDMPVIDKLASTIKQLPEDVAVVSPKLMYPDGTVQSCGRAPRNWKIYMLQALHLWDESKSKYVNQEGVFQSYNIVGAAFLIKTDVFEKMGWFDERYFFSPEDLALSTALNQSGYKCYVNADVCITHYEGMSAKSLSMIQTATRPAALKGSIILHSHGNPAIKAILNVFCFSLLLPKFIYHRIKGLLKKRPNYDYILSVGDMNCMEVFFTDKTPKQLFTKFYSKIKK